MGSVERCHAWGRVSVVVATVHCAITAVEHAAAANRVVVSRAMKVVVPRLHMIVISVAICRRRMVVVVARVMPDPSRLATEVAAAKSAIESAIETAI